jgi:hypothetical protein
MQSRTPSASPQDSFSALAGVGQPSWQRTHQSASTKVRMLAINRNPLQTVIGQNEPTQDFLGIANVL